MDPPSGEDSSVNNQSPGGDTPALHSAGRWVLQRPIEKPLSLPLYNVSAYWPAWLLERMPAAVWPSTRGELSLRVMVVITSVKPLRIWIDEEVFFVGLTVQISA